MRILHVVPTYLPARRYGGPIFAIHGLARALVARGHDVDVFTTNVDGDGVSEVPLGRRVDLDGVGVHYFPAVMRRLYWSPQLRRALAATISRYAVVHAHSIFLDPTTAAARAAARAGIPYLIAPRGMLVPELIHAKSRFTKTLWLRLIERRNFERAARIHFTATREWSDALRAHLPLPSPLVVPNGIDLLSPPDVTRDDRTIAYLGRINWKKRLDLIIEALPGLPGAHFHIAGNDEESLTSRLRAIAAQSGVSDRVHFPGPLYGEAKFAFLAAAAVFVLPSISENFGNVLLEAAMMSTPTVVAPGIGLADALAGADAGVVTNDFAPVLAALLADPTRRAELGRNGRRLVEARFTWPAIAGEMEAAYCSITSHR